MNSVFLFLPLIIFFEGKLIFLHWKSLLSLSYWVVMNLAGILGFLIGIVTIAQISLTSPLTHNISGTAKACVQTIIAVLFLNEKMSLRSAFGTFCVLFGTFLYSLVRNWEMDHEKKQKTNNGVEVLVKNTNEEGESDAKDTDEKPLLPNKEKE